MPSIHAQYNEEIVQAHREALAALRELLADETDPLERRRLAIAILRARPVKEPAPQTEPATAAATPPTQSRKTEEPSRATDLSPQPRSGSSTGDKYEDAATLLARATEEHDGNLAMPSERTGHPRSMQESRA